MNQTFSNHQPTIDKPWTNHESTIALPAAGGGAKQKTQKEKTVCKLCFAEAAMQQIDSTLNSELRELFIPCHRTVLAQIYANRPLSRNTSHRVSQRTSVKHGTSSPPSNSWRQGSGWEPTCPAKSCWSRWKERRTNLRCLKCFNRTMSCHKKTIQHRFGRPQTCNILWGWNM